MSMEQFSSTDGILEDVTEQTNLRQARMELFSDMQSILLLLLQPVVQVMREAVVCPAGASIKDAAELMSLHRSDALLVRSGAGSCRYCDRRRLAPAGRRRRHRSAASCSRHHELSLENSAARSCP